MNTLSRIAPAIIVLLTASFFPSCYKIYDYVKQHPGSEVDVCRVKYLVDGSDTVAIHYNAARDPIDMVKNRFNNLWQSDKVFRYDNKQRITDYIWATKGSNYRLIWHRYGYPRKSIVTDSLFTYINDGSGPNPPKGNFSYLSVDSLDEQGRIVKKTDYLSESSDVYVNTFKYNTQGNLDTPNAVYDNKLSIMHTNKVWMFLNNDYSINNRLNNEGGLLQISNYNQAGLPLDFSIAPGHHGSDVLFATVTTKMLVTYDCD